MLGHANAAIAGALDDDRALTMIALNIRSLDFGALNDYQRQSAVELLLKQASWVRTNAHAADDHVKRVQSYAKATADPAMQADRVAFADALGAAVALQEKAATNLVGSITVLAGRQDRNGVDTTLANGANTVGPPIANPNPYQPSAYRGVVGQNQSPQGTTTATQRYTTGVPGAPVQPADLAKIFSQLVRPLNDALTEILKDEGTAADHALAATSGC
jgi:hypothetical protein